MQCKYDVKKQYEVLIEQQPILEAKFQEAKKQLEEEKENFLIFLQKVVKDNQQLILTLQKLSTSFKKKDTQYKEEKEKWEIKIHEGEQKIEMLLKENKYLQMEGQTYKERLSHAYQHGFQKARSQQQKQKRYRESAKPPFMI
ncbi:hypothetical protein [Virgibacillus halodenitrificans]|uniref:hypothetical protein n=1 Tax=Virgibacillus halodenitrificans TaxID=1482 RepID=UPI000EF4D68C|nr:hypothetical protein [Virgibacillus halodenitrificans]